MRPSSALRIGKKKLVISNRCTFFILTCRESARAKKQPLFTWEVFIAQVLVGLSKQLKHIIQTHLGSAPVSFGVNVFN